MFSILFTRRLSASLMSALEVNFRTRLRGFLVSMCRAWLCRRRILPAPVTLNRLAALLLVLVFYRDDSSRLLGRGERLLWHNIVTIL